jgi:hypothetical protein
VLSVLISKYNFLVSVSLSEMKCDEPENVLPLERHTDFIFEWKLSFENGTRLDYSLEPILILYPKRLAERWTDDTALNLSLIVSAAGYYQAQTSVQVFKTRVLEIPSWIQIQPFGINLPLDRHIQLTAVLLPVALFRNQNMTMSCSWNCFKIQEGIDGTRNLTDCGSVAANSFSVLQTPGIKISPQDLALDYSQAYLIAVSCVVSIEKYKYVRELSTTSRFYVSRPGAIESAIFPLNLKPVKIDDSFGVVVIGQKSAFDLCSYWPLKEFYYAKWAIYQWNHTNWAVQNLVFPTANRIISFPANWFVKWSLYRIDLTITRNFQPDDNHSDFIDLETQNSTSTFQFLVGSSFGGATLSIEPASGIAFETIFKFVLPEFSAVTSNEVFFKFGLTWSNRDILFRDGAAIGEPCARAFLPPGSVEIWAEIFDIYGDKLRVNNTIFVQPPTRMPSMDIIRNRYETAAYDQEMASAFNIALSIAVAKGYFPMSQELIKILLNFKLQRMLDSPSTLEVFDVLDELLVSMELLVNISGVSDDQNFEANKQSATAIIAAALRISGNVSISKAVLQSALSVFSFFRDIPSSLGANESLHYEHIGAVMTGVKLLDNLITSASAIGDRELLLKNAGILPDLPFEEHDTGIESINVSSKDGSISVLLLKNIPIIINVNAPGNSSGFKYQGISLDPNTTSSVSRIVFEPNFDGQHSLMVQVWESSLLSSSNITFLSPVVALAPVSNSIGEVINPENYTVWGVAFSFNWTNATNSKRSTRRKLLDSDATPLCMSRIGTAQKWTSDQCSTQISVAQSEDNTEIMCLCARSEWGLVALYDSSMHDILEVVSEATPASSSKRYVSVV